MPIVNGSYSPPNNFTQQYNLGQKKIRADLVDENFNDAAGAITQLLVADGNSVHKTGNETINGDKTFNGNTTFNGDVDINGDLACAGDAVFSGNVEIQNLGTQLKTLILQTVFPVGSIYTTTNGTNPASLFGFGTWEQIPGRMILGVSGSHPVGQTGGEEAHTLSIAETPAHNHSRGSMNITGHFVSDDECLNVGGAFSIGNAYPYDATSKTSGGARIINFNAANAWSGETSYVGGNGAHNNMPPFYAAYIWRRRA